MREKLSSSKRPAHPHTHGRIGAASSRICRHSYSAPTEGVDLQGVCKVVPSGVKTQTPTLPLWQLRSHWPAHLTHPRSMANRRPFVQQPQLSAFAMRGESMAIAGRMRARERRHGPHAVRHASKGGSGARATHALPRERRARPPAKTCVQKDDCAHALANACDDDDDHRPRARVHHRPRARPREQLPKASCPEGGEGRQHHQSTRPPWGLGDYSGRGRLHTVSGTRSSPTLLGGVSAWSAVLTPWTSCPWADRRNLPPIRVRVLVSGRSGPQHPSSGIERETPFQPGVSQRPPMVTG